MSNKATPPFNLNDACNNFAEHYQKVVLATGAPKVEFTPLIEQTIKKLVQYFCNVPQEGIELRKGIYIKGPYGTGKSRIMVAFSTWRGNKRPFRMVNTRDIQKDCAAIGYTVLNKYSKQSYNYKNGMHLREHGPITYCFDDFGAEKVSKFYGTEINVMEELLQDRYIEFEETGMITHATSNLKDGVLIEQMYGPRVRDRMRQMFNFVTLDGKSFRK